MNIDPGLELAKAVSTVRELAGKAKFVSVSKKAASIGSAVAGGKLVLNPKYVPAPFARNFAAMVVFFVLSQALIFTIAFLKPCPYFAIKLGVIAQ